MGCRCGRKGGELTGPNPTDRGKAGSKYHILCDANGLPLHAMLSAANTHDSKLFEPLLETNPAVRGRRGRRGRPRRRPDKVHADKGYDFRRCRQYLHRRGIKVQIARRGMERGVGLAIAAAVEPVAVGAPGQGGQRCDPAEHRERRLAA